MLHGNITKNLIVQCTEKRLICLKTTRAIVLTLQTVKTAATALTAPTRQATVARTQAKALMKVIRVLTALILQTRANNC